MFLLMALFLFSLDFRFFFYSPFPCWPQPSLIWSYPRGLRPAAAVVAAAAAVAAAAITAAAITAAAITAAAAALSIKGSDEWGINLLASQQIELAIS